MLLALVLANSLIGIGTLSPTPTIIGTPEPAAAAIAGQDCNLVPIYTELASRAVTWATWPQFLSDIRAVNAQHTARHFHLPPGLDQTTPQSYQIRVTFLQKMATSRIAMMKCPAPSNPEPPK